MVVLAESVSGSFTSRFGSGVSLSRVKGIVISDTHIGAPYADEEMAERVLYNELDAKNNNKFCVLLGDVYEGVNMPVKDLHRTDEKANNWRAEKIRDYVTNRFPVKEPVMIDMLKRLPDVSEEEVNLVLNHHLVKDGKLIIVNPEGERRIREIYRKARVRSDVESETIGAHMDRLATLVKTHPDCVFHYIIGNHERLPEYLNAIHALEDELNEPGRKNRLNVVEDYLKIGDGLFIHGDQQLNPEKYHMDEPDKFTEAHVEMDRTKFWQVVNDYGNKIVPSLILKPTIHRIQRSAGLILDWCHENEPVMLKGARHVFFGHTHVPYTSETVIDKADGKKYLFHNTGAALSRFKSLNKDAFNPLRLTLTPSLGTPPENQARGKDHHVFYEGSSLAVERIMQPDLQRA